MNVLELNLELDQISNICSGLVMYTVRVIRPTDQWRQLRLLQ